MAVIYLDYATGNDSDSGLTWALAKKTLDAAITAAGTDGTIYVVNTNAETSTGANVGFTFLSGQKLISTSDTSNEPPQSVATGATFSVTGGYFLTLNLYDGCYVYGCTFESGSGSTANYNVSAKTEGGTGYDVDFGVFDSCSFRSLNTGNTCCVVVGNNTYPAKTRFVNCGFEALHGIRGTGRSSIVEIEGGSLTASSASVMFSASSFPGGPSTMLVRGMDLSGANASADLIDWDIDYNVHVINCKMPASWSGALRNSSMNWGTEFSLQNLPDYNSSNYEFRYSNASGDLTDDSSVYRTNGADDGNGTKYSWKIVSTSRCDRYARVFRSPEMVIWNDTTGSSVNVTAHIAHDSQGSGTSSDFETDEVWLEVLYQNTSDPKFALASDAAALLATAPGDQDDDSSEGWTTTPLTTPVKQKLVATVTPQEKGFIVARVCVGVPSKTVYVCPKIELS